MDAQTAKHINFIKLFTGMDLTNLVLEGQARLKPEMKPVGFWDDSFDDDFHKAQESSFSFFKFIFFMFFVVFIVIVVLGIKYGKFEQEGEVKITEVHTTTVAPPAMDANINMNVGMPSHSVHMNVGMPSMNVKVEGGAMGMEVSGGAFGGPGVNMEVNSGAMGMNMSGGMQMSGNYTVKESYSGPDGTFKSEFKAGF